ncbi:MAG: phosphoribosylformylglycinamidine cyclo-ligase [Candidatus Omnitrophica bacterium CG1_02_40_15]|nr:MAG: phosphoribosylformylglycinamidine cyclo-ligase [Candidatus Omnitrophica bacterium CG1_02_40_15]
MDYKRSGVNIDRANDFVKDIGRMAKTTRRKEVICDIGGFSALTSIPKKYKEPILVSSTDGVGTKLKIADSLNKHDTIGIDLVAMSVNDVVVTGAEPLLFLDYFATGKLNSKKAVGIMKGIVKGCRQAGCALVGGETAEMPSMYNGEEYDLAGFSVGIVEKTKIIDGKSVNAGDIVIGIGSSGPHSNGFSLIRKLFSKSELKGKFGRIFLTPTIIYVKAILKLMEKVKIKSIAHITGGGFYDNIPRVVPSDKSVLIYKELWQVPQIFRVIQKRAGISYKEMHRTFNMGIGMVIVVSKSDVKKAHEIIKKFRLKSWTIGEIIKGNGEVII